MVFFLCLFLFCFVMGLIGVASNPSPFFAAFGLVVVSGMGCGMLLGYGAPFLSLVLFLIYLGGMLVVFAYSAALAAEPYPEAWGNQSVMTFIVIYGVLVLLGSSWFWAGWDSISLASPSEADAFYLFHSDIGGVGLMYSSGGWMLVISVWALLLTLFAVLEVTRGLSRGALRAV